MSQIRKKSIIQSAVVECKSIPRVTTQRRGNPRIVLPVKETNIVAVRNFMLECLVPILAEEFLRRRGDAEESRIKPETSNPTFQPVGKEAVR
jgi:hypothetical protein